MPTLPCRLGTAVLAALLAFAAPAFAEVESVSATQFVVTHRADVAAAPETVWHALVEPARWWSDAHTWSGRAANLSLEPQAGGCWCERWGDGHTAQHARVSMVMAGRLLRLDARLGPLMDLPVQGVLNLGVGTRDGKTVLRFSYRVGGPPEAGLEALAPAVDQVLGMQFQRLKRLVETGRVE